MNGSAPVLARLLLLSLSLLSMASGLQAGSTQIFTHQSVLGRRNSCQLGLGGLPSWLCRTHTVGQALHAPRVQTPSRLQTANCAVSALSWS